MCDAPICGAPADAGKDDEFIKSLLMENLSRLETGSEGAIELIEIHVSC